MEIENENAELDRLQAAYQAAVEEWRVAIGEEEALASVNHSVKERFRNLQIECRNHPWEHGIDGPEITGWTWPY